MQSTGDEAQMNMTSAMQAMHFLPGAGYDFRLDGKKLKLGAGDVVFVPRGTPHGFLSTGPEIGRQLIISSPRGIFDAMIAEVTMLDTGSPTRQGSEEAKFVATKYGLEFLTS